MWLTFKKAIPGFVLILVVMEEGQRQWFTEITKVSLTVLILVVMEEGQRHYSSWCYAECYSYIVLILVVMEEGQRPLFFMVLR